MARPIEESLSYFPLDVDIFDDPKILFIADRFDSKGEIIMIKLLCWIYRNGYYCQWNDEHALIFAKKNFSSIKAGLCQDVVSELLKRGFFNEDIFESFGVLTSKAIQKRWQNVIDKSRRKAELKHELNLLVHEETLLKPTETQGETVLSTQSKVKESKVKERRKSARGEGKKYIPTQEEIKDYFRKNGYDSSVAEKAFNIYNASVEDNPKRRYWRDSRDNPIKNWKLKMQSVWFTEENKKSNSHGHEDDYLIRKYSKQQEQEKNHGAS